VKKLARELNGSDIGSHLTYTYNTYDSKYACWKTAIRTSPITMITHKKDMVVNVRVGPSEGHTHQGETQFRPEDEVEVSRESVSFVL
jgi:hypothetical protein